MEPFDSLKCNSYKYLKCDGRCNASPLYFNDKPIASMEKACDLFATIAPTFASRLADSGHVRCQHCEDWFHATWEPRDLFWFYQPLPNLAQPSNDKLRLPQDTALESVMKIFHSPWRSDAQLFFIRGRFDAEQALSLLIDAITKSAGDYDRAELVKTFTSLLALENPHLAERQKAQGSVWRHAPPPEFAASMMAHRKMLQGEKFPKQLIQGYITDLERLAAILRQDSNGSKILFRDSHLRLW